MLHAQTCGQLELNGRTPQNCKCRNLQLKYSLHEEILVIIYDIPCKSLNILNLNLD